MEEKNYSRTLTYLLKIRTLIVNVTLYRKNLDKKCFRIFLTKHRAIKFDNFSCSQHRDHDLSYSWSSDL